MVPNCSLGPMEEIVPPDVILPLGNIPVFVALGSKKSFTVKTTSSAAVIPEFFIKITDCALDSVTFTL